MSVSQTEPHRPLTTCLATLLTGTSRSCSLFLRTIRNILVYSWINLLLVFVPVGFITYLAKADPSIIFTSNALAVIAVLGNRVPRP